MHTPLAGAPFPFMSADCFSQTPGTSFADQQASSIWTNQPALSIGQPSELTKNQPPNLLGIATWRGSALPAPNQAGTSLRHSQTGRTQPPRRDCLHQKCFWGHQGRSIGSLGFQWEGCSAVSTVRSTNLAGLWNSTAGNRADARVAQLRGQPGDANAASRYGKPSAADWVSQLKLRPGPAVCPWLLLQMGAAPGSVSDLAPRPAPHTQSDATQRHRSSRQARRSLATSNGPLPMAPPIPPNGITTSTASNAMLRSGAAMSLSSASEAGGKLRTNQQPGRLAWERCSGAGGTVRGQQQQGLAGGEWAVHAWGGCCRATGTAGQHRSCEGHG